MSTLSTVRLIIFCFGGRGASSLLCDQCKTPLSLQNSCFTSSFTSVEPPPPPPSPRGACRRWGRGGRAGTRGRGGRRGKAGKVFAGSSNQVRGSRVHLQVSLLQVPVSKILQEERPASDGLFHLHTSTPASCWHQDFSLRSTFSLLSLFSSYRQQNFTRLPCHFYLLSSSSLTLAC